MKGSEVYRPSTFEARGTAVPFTTPMLSQARVRRDDRDRLEILVASIADSNSTYVIPWDAIDEMFKLTVHDVYLQKAVKESEGTSPEEIRNAALKAAKTGLAGSEAKRSAKAALRADDDARILINYLLVISMMQTFGGSGLQGGIMDVTSEHGQMMAKEAIASAAQPLGLTPEDLYQRISDIAECMAPIGLANAPAPGRMRSQFDALRRFHSEIGEWAELDPSEKATIGEFIAATAKLTVVMAQEVLQTVDARMAQMEQTMRSWDVSLKAIRSETARLSWLLDGWNFIIVMWEHAAHGSPADQYAAIDQIFRVLPLIPSQEMRGKEQEENIRSDLMMRKRVLAGEDWRTGDMDLDLVERLEAVRAATVL